MCWVRIGYVVTSLQLVSRHAHHSFADFCPAVHIKPYSRDNTTAHNGSQRLVACSWLSAKLKTTHSSMPRRSQILSITRGWHTKIRMQLVVRELHRRHAHTMHIGGGAPRLWWQAQEGGVEACPWAV